MRRVEGNGTSSHRFTSKLLVALVAASAALLCGCGEAEVSPISTEDLAAAPIARSVEALDGAGERIEQLALQADALQKSIIELAEANQEDVVAWKKEWTDRQSDYAAAVAAVDEYNAGLPEPIEQEPLTLDRFDVVDGVIVRTPVEVAGASWVPASLKKPYPAAPQPPAGLSVEPGPLLRQLRALAKTLRGVEDELGRPSSPSAPDKTSMAVVAVTDAPRLLLVSHARATLAAAVDEVEQVVADLRTALDRGITSDPLMGDVCTKPLTKLELSAAGAVEEARAALVMAAGENRIAPAGLSWASSLPAD
jgi:hypothetical protein